MKLIDFIYQLDNEVTKIKQLSEQNLIILTTDHINEIINMVEKLKELAIRDLVDNTNPDDYTSELIFEALNHNYEANKLMDKLTSFKHWQVFLSDRNRWSLLYNYKIKDLLPLAQVIINIYDPELISHLRIWYRDFVDESQLLIELMDSI